MVAIFHLLEIVSEGKVQYSLLEVLYKQVDGVAMGSPLGPLMANAFMCNIEEQLTNQNKMPNFYKRYVDNTLSIMPMFNSSCFHISLNIE